MYHYFIGRDGTVVQTRDESERTGHTMSEEYNNDSLAIVLAGDFNVEVPSRKQLASLNALLVKLQGKYHIPDDHIVGHQDASHTSCPGEKLLKLLPTHYHPEQ